MLITLIAVLAVYMVACAWCGFQQKLLRFVAVLVAALTLNMVWMATALQARPSEPDAIIALAAATLYGLGAFGMGWLVGRLARQFRDSQVDADAPRV